MSTSRKRRRTRCEPTLTDVIGLLIGIQNDLHRLDTGCDAFTLETRLENVEHDLSLLVGRFDSLIAAIRDLVKGRNA